MLNTWKIGFLILLIAWFSLTNNSVVYAQSSIAAPPYSSSELNIIKQYLFNNIMTEDHVLVKEDEGRIIYSIPGAVIASPVKKNVSFVQDYQFHWVRDAAITMYEVASLYSQASVYERKQLKPYLLNYIHFEQKAQKQISKSGNTLGEPKYNIDGTVWEGDWGRPQNDGPALRAITLTFIANMFVQEGEEKFVRDVLYEMVTTDLDYLTLRWRDTNYDLWEEVSDQDHFFTKMVERRALIDGAALMRNLDDGQRAETYMKTAAQVTESLQTHWNASRGYFAETINQQYLKGGGLDSSIILGVLLGDIGNMNDPFAVNNDRVMSSIYFIRNAFAGLYRVNIDHRFSPPLIGRYPNDVYDGGQNVYGNPWVLTTNALAQYYYALANAYVKQGKINVTQTNLLFFQQINPSFKVEIISLADNPGKFYAVISSLVNEGDQALQAIKNYAVCYTDFSCYHFAEQIDRTSGQQISAKDLTWGYASILTAMQTRWLIQKAQIHSFS